MISGRTLPSVMSRLTMRHLRIVLAIAEYGNFAAAARQLNVTQSAITKALLEAETHLGVELFTRTNRGAIPTAFGQALLDHAHLIVAQLDHAAESIQDLRDGTGGRVVVGAILMACSELLPSAIVALRKERPRLAVGVVEGLNDRLLPDLRIGRLDLVVGRLPEFHQRAGLMQEVLLTDMACVVCRKGHPVVKQRHIKLGDLVNHNWIFPPSETMLRRHIDNAFRDEKVEPPSHAVISVSQLTNRALILKGDYLGVWPWMIVQNELRAGTIAILPITLRATVGPVGISTRADAKPSPAAEMFIRSLRKVSASLGSCPFLSDD
jgi:DNA-binding transcriptional LysR family regulator